MKLTLTVDVDDRRWFVLAGRADRDDVRVADILEAEIRAAVVRLTSPEHPVPAESDPRGANPYATSRPYTDALRRDIIGRMWRDGHSSVAIGRRIGTTNLCKIRATLWDLGYNPRDRIGHPRAGERPRPNKQSIPALPPTRRGRPPKEEAA